VRPAPLRLATRGSALARWQASEVERLLREVDPELEVELVVVATTGDQRQDVPVWQMGGQGVFVKEVQAALLDGRADAAVHSAKDLPSRPAPALVLAAVPPRADPRDALVGSTLAGLGPGARVATGSVRRRAQLAWLRPDLTFAGLRGNIATRLDRVPARGAVVVAMAALERLGLAARATEVLDVSVMLPQVGQGAIGVECRAGDEATAELLASIDDAISRASVETERSFLARLGGGCDLPVGAYATIGSGGITVEGLLASPDGRVMLRGARTGASPSIGAELAESLLTSGGSDLMAGGPDAVAGGPDVVAGWSDVVAGGLGGGRAGQQSDGAATT
jgi:hydroxymethylbilane synthase